LRQRAAVDRVGDALAQRGVKGQDPGLFGAVRSVGISHRLTGETGVSHHGPIA